MINHYNPLLTPFFTVDWAWSECQDCDAKFAASAGSSGGLATSGRGGDEIVGIDGEMPTINH